MTGEKDAPDHIVEANKMVDAPAAMPTREQVEAEILPMTYDGADLTECVERVMALFAPILAEKERAELALCDLMNAAGHYKATHSEIDREALSATIKAAADHFAAAIRAEGE